MCLDRVMPRSHQRFRAVKLRGIMVRNRCWPTAFHTQTIRDADGWCLPEVTGVISPSILLSKSISVPDLGMN